ncbi:MAG: diguanylate cyclase domain-containing protein, partial [Janthinobacterium lividum]
MQVSLEPDAAEERDRSNPGSQGAAREEPIPPQSQLGAPVSGEVDYLTGIANRAHFANVLERRLEDMRKGTTGGVCALYLDLDRFKQVNDTLGHGVGDDLLKLVSTRLRGEISKDDTLARLGGDEFAMILTELSEREELSHLAQRLIDLVQRTYLIEG